MKELLEALLKIMSDYGVPIALLIFFVWRDFRREETMSAVIRRLEGEMREILKEQVASVTRALINNTACMRELIAMLRTRPCLAKDIAESIIQGTLEGYPSNEEKGD